MANSEAAALLASKRTLLSEVERYFRNQMELPENSSDIKELSKYIKILRLTDLKCSEWKSKLSELENDLHGFDLAFSDLEALFTEIDDFYTLTRKLSCTLDETERISPLALYNVHHSLTAIMKYFDLLTLESVVLGDRFHILPSEVSDYIKIGKQLTDLPEMLVVRNALASLILDDDTSSIYVAIVGPSYMGKTQSAFALAHAMNVFYVNLLLVRGSEDVQLVYRPFGNIAEIFFNSLSNDMPSVVEDNENTGLKSSLIRASSVPLQTLGLLYTLLRIKHQLPQDFSVEDWFLFFINLKNIIIPKMTVSQFRTQTRNLNIDLRDSVVFIDELASEPGSIETAIKFLRNICRAVHLPVILSGTNSKAQDHVETACMAYSRVGPPSPWVKVVTQLPKATLASIGQVIKFQAWDDEGEYSLTSFTDSSGENIDFDRLIGKLLNISSFNEDDVFFLKNLMDFVIIQSRTNLPGLAIISIQMLFDLILELRGQSDINHRGFWGKMLLQIQAIVLGQMRMLGGFEARIASIHILSYTSSVKSTHELGEPVARKVNNHLFYFGVPEDVPIFELSAEVHTDGNGLENYVVFSRDRQTWKDHCYFPALSKDFFAHFVAWNSWWEKRRDEEFTLAAAYEKYLKDYMIHRVHSEAIVTDAFTLELLAHWSISCASHYDVHGETGGLDLTREFIKNLQRVPESNVAAFGRVEFPAELEAFLSQVVIPYLVPSHALEPSFVNLLKPFMSLGRSWRPQNNVGWDVVFDAFVNGQYNTCFIECKLWRRSVDLALIYKYYNHACQLGSAVSFLVVRKFQPSLQKRFENVTDEEIQIDVENRPADEKSEDDDEEAATNDLDIQLERLETETLKTTKASVQSNENYKIALGIQAAGSGASTSSKRKRSSIITRADFAELWKDPKNRINIYTVTSAVETIVSMSRGVLEKAVGIISLKFKALKEFPNPTGVFIITQASFPPSSRSSSG